MLQGKVPARQYETLQPMAVLSEYYLPKGYRLVVSERVGYMIRQDEPGPNDPEPGSFKIVDGKAIFTIYTEAPGAQELFAMLVLHWLGKGVTLRFDEVTK